MRKFYIKHADGYLYCKNNNLIENWSHRVFSLKIYAVKFTDKEYDSIKPLLPKDHTLELVVDETTMPKWVKKAFASGLLYFLCVLVILIALKTQTSKVCFIFLIGFLSNDIVRWITNR